MIYYFSDTDAVEMQEGARRMKEAQSKTVPPRYVVDEENPAEMARLTKQARLVTKRMGLLPDGMKLVDHATVLDIGCGPGEWGLALASLLPHTTITGIDISQAMIAYAQEMAQEQQASRVTFVVMDAHKPLAFPDAHFDLIHMRFANAFLSTTLWPSLLQECRRILRPGGCLVSLEAEGLGISNSLSLTRYNQLMIEAMRRLGQCFVSCAEGTGITALQASLLRQAGFQITGNNALSIDYSFGVPDHEAVGENWMVLLKLLQPLLLRLDLIDEEALAVLYERTREEVQSSAFCALGYAHRVWAIRPLRDAEPVSMMEREKGVLEWRRTNN